MGALPIARGYAWSRSGWTALPGTTLAFRLGFPTFAEEKGSRLMHHSIILDDLERAQQQGVQQRRRIY